MRNAGYHPGEHSPGTSPMGKGNEMSTELDMPPTIDRRSALKKAAVAAGVTAWVTPAVLAVTESNAGAAITNCAGRSDMVLIHAAANCSNVGVPPNCCDNQGYFFVLGTANGTCGASCGGASGATNEVVTLNGCATGHSPCNYAARCAQFPYIDRTNCNGAPLTVYLKVTTAVTCPDGKRYTCVYDGVRFDLIGCPPTVSPTTPLPTPSCTVA